MKIIVEATPKEIAALVMELQERRGLEKIPEMGMENSGIKLCADNAFKD